MLNFLKYDRTVPYGIYSIPYPCDSSSSCGSISGTFLRGKYKFELWGARGGDVAEGYGGRGGYTVANVTFLKDIIVFINLGAVGSCRSDVGETESSYNGGGKGAYRNDGDGPLWSCGGGGSTDIRLGHNIFENRILVAGGGGGSGNDERTGSTGKFYGGYGGGEIAGDGELGNHPLSQNGEGANTSSPGLFGYPGGFGYGGNSSGSSGGGGGGGYYGGAAGSIACGGGGGGSGFVAGSFSNVLIETGHTISGNDSIPSFEGDDIVIGHGSHGAIRITIFSQHLIYPVNSVCNSAVWLSISLMFSLLISI